MIFFFFLNFELVYSNVIFVVNTWIWGFTTGSQSVPKSCTTMKWAYLHNNTKLPTLNTLQSELQNSTDYCRSVDL